MLRILALCANLLLVLMEGVVLGHLKNKRDVLKYYTYLQNFLALTASLVFSVCLIAQMLTGKNMPAFAGGLRYVASCGLAAAAFIFVVFLGAGKKISMTEEDFLSSFSPRAANAVLHSVCPALSLISFAALERSVLPENGFWTVAAAIPSCVYWGVYAILSACKLWEEPYAFSAEGNPGRVKNVLPYVLIPLSFVAITFALWQIRQ